jgi:hypothetical protein
MLLLAYFIIFLPPAAGKGQDGGGVILHSKGILSNPMLHSHPGPPIDGKGTKGVAVKKREKLNSDAVVLPKTGLILDDQLILAYWVTVLVITNNGDEA